MESLVLVRLHTESMNSSNTSTGKTLLASLVVEEVKRLRRLHGISVGFFYCKHGDERRITFLAVATSLLSQLLQQNPHLLPHFYEKASTTGDAALTSISIAQELLSTALKSAGKTYIILDGLDECPRNERKEISIWFQSLVESLSPADYGSIRCLFISQDDGYARKDIGGLPTLTITSTHNQLDIESFAIHQAGQAQDPFGLSDEKRLEIIQKVTRGSGGKAPTKPPIL